MYDDETKDNVSQMTNDVVSTAFELEDLLEGENSDPSDFVDVLENLEGIVKAGLVLMRGLRDG